MHIYGFRSCFIKSRECRAKIAGHGEAGGTSTADSSINSLAGKPAEGVTRSTERVRSLRFDGTGTVVSGVDGTVNVFDTRRGLTVSVWAKPDAAAPLVP
ncbi:hypothetical protein Q0Z83_041310 [Actinoplanes sichuanensis]|nr:hypothetical protein Q0Z83_041310 [Actinoplanes sichuanensis]